MKSAEKTYDFRMWSRLLERLERAHDTAQANKKRRAEIVAEDLALMISCLRAGLSGNTPRALRPRHDAPRMASEIVPITPQDKAAMHVLAARAKLIDDPSPNKTVREYFDVSREAVQQWVRAEEAEPGIATFLVNKAGKSNLPTAAWSLDIRQTLPPGIR